MNWLFKDPLRKWFSFDKFPYEIGDDELEIDFMLKAGLYGWTLLIASFMFLEGGWAVYLTWVLVNVLRRKQ